MPERNRFPEYLSEKINKQLFFQAPSPLKSNYMYRFLLPFAFVICTLAPSFSQDFGWALNLGGSSLETPESTTLDEFGNIYITGTFNLTADLDPGPGVLNVTSAGMSDMFVVKLNPEGRLLWARHISGPDAEVARVIRVDARGYVVMAGLFSGTVDFDPGTEEHILTSSGSYDAFILKLDPEGRFAWVNQMGGSESDAITGLSIDPRGNIYTCGAYSGTGDFDPGPDVMELTSAGGSDVFITKMDWKGTLEWARSIGGAQVESVDDLTVDAQGFVYTMGVFRNIADMDPGPGTANLNVTGGFYANMFIQKMDASGQFVWAKQVTGSYFQFGSEIKTDGTENLYISGTFSETADFDPGPGTVSLTANGYDPFILNLDLDGNLVWARHITGSGNQTEEAKSIGFDKDGAVYVCGIFSQTADFNPGPGVFNLASASGSEDAFLMKLDSAGNMIWARRMGGTGADGAVSLHLDPYGNMFMLGSFAGTVDFNPLAPVNNLVSAGFIDIFLLNMTQNWNFSGTVFHDVNENGTRETDEPGLKNVLISVPEAGAFATTDDAGQYRIYSNIVGDTLKAAVNKPLWTITPAFAIPDSMETPMDFAAVYPLYHDLCLVTVNATRFRPGFTTDVQIYVTNIGTLPVDSAKVDLLIVTQTTPLPLEFISGNPTPTVEADDHFSWIIDSLGVGQSMWFTLRFRTPENTPINTPVVFSSSVGPEDDANFENNFSRYTNQVVNAVDPNDKQVSPEMLMQEQLDTSALQYVIRFQNTGNFPASFVVIRDTLPAQLDLSTLQVQGASHPFVWRVYNERVLEFRFDPIDLPDSISNEPGSHGFVAFQAKTRSSSLAPGDSIVNSAGIYFDYNAPVITPPAVFRVASLPVGVHYPAVASLDFSLMPNPGTQGRAVMLEFPERLKYDTQVAVYDAKGQVLHVLHCPEGQQKCYLPVLPAGVFMVQARTGNRSGAKVLFVR